MKFISWQHTDLRGIWEISYKLDGVRGICRRGRWISRTGNLLYNLPNLPDGIYEVFVEDFDTTISAVRTVKGTSIDPINCYSLDPIDIRIKIGDFTNPTYEEIMLLFRRALEQGHEGLVLKQGNLRLKVKAEETYDVKITGFIEGKGRNKGRLGALTTGMGNVGTGLTDEQRNYIWSRQDYFLGKTVEISCTSLTKDGKFRHPKFIRMRLDKS